MGGGFTLSPDTGLLALGGEYELVPQLGVGPLVQFGIDDDNFIFAPTANARYRFALGGRDDDFLSRLEPFLQFGLGFAVIDKDRPGGDRDGTEFLMNGGFGLDVRVAPAFTLGSSMLFNGMPAGKAAGEHFFFSWQLVTARVHF